jgi:hypothetical protein
VLRSSGGEESERRRVMTDEISQWHRVRKITETLEEEPMNVTVKLHVTLHSERIKYIEINYYFILKKIIQRKLKHHS